MAASTLAITYQVADQASAAAPWVRLEQEPVRSGALTETDLLTMLALVQAVERIPANTRSVVISGAGDRRDIDIQRQTEILGDAFDDVILYEDQCQRGRADGEVLALLRAGLVNAQRARHTQEIRGEFLAIDTALSRLKEGDLCLILIDQVEEALAHIAKRIAEAN